GLGRALGGDPPGRPDALPVAAFLRFFGGRRRFSARRQFFPFPFFFVFGLGRVVAHVRASFIAQRAFARRVAGRPGRAPVDRRAVAARPRGRDARPAVFGGFLARRFASSPGGRAPVAPAVGLAGVSVPRAVPAASTAQRSRDARARTPNGSVDHELGRAGGELRVGDGRGSRRRRAALVRGG